MPSNARGASLGNVAEYTFVGKLRRKATQTPQQWKGADAAVAATIRWRVQFRCV